MITSKIEDAYNLAECILEAVAIAIGNEDDDRHNNDDMKTCRRGNADQGCVNLGKYSVYGRNIDDEEKQQKSQKEAEAKAIKKQEALRKRSIKRHLKKVQKENQVGLF